MLHFLGHPVQLILVQKPNFYLFNDTSSKYLNSAGEWSSQRSEGGECTDAEFPKESDKRNGSNCSLLFFLI